MSVLRQANGRDMTSLTWRSLVQSNPKAFVVSFWIGQNKGRQSTVPGGQPGPVGRHRVAMGCQ